MSSICCQTIFDDRPNQTMLDAFFPELCADDHINSPHTQQNPRFTKEGKWQLDLKIKQGNFVVLVDTHCPICQRQLNKNGTNPKVEYNNIEKDKNIFFFQRYYCNECGEIHLDYSKFFKSYGKYDNKLSKQVRLVFFLGIPPCKIQEISIAMLELIIPLSTIKSWIYPLKIPLKEALYPVHMPCSGSVAYDEVYLKIAKNKEYLQVSLDNFTNLVIFANVCKHLDKKALIDHFQHMQKDQQLVIESVVRDGANIYDTVFNDPILEHIIQGRCHTHYKRNIREKIYKAAGLGKKLKKQLPGGYFKLLRHLYWTIGSKTDFHFWTRLEGARSLANTLHNEKLNSIIDWVEESQEHLLNHNHTENLAKTTNKLESINHEIEVYRVLKKGQKTEMGAELVANSRIFLHNMRELCFIGGKLEKETRYLDDLQDQFGYCSGIRSKKVKHGHFIRKINQYRDNLESYWRTYLPKGALKLFKKLWAIKH